MKLIKGNGRTLEVRDVGPVLYEMTANQVPILEYGTRIVSDDEARALINKFRQQGHAGRAVKTEQDSASS